MSVPSFSPTSAPDPGAMTGGRYRPVQNHQAQRETSVGARAEGPDTAPDTRGRRARFEDVLACLQDPDRLSGKESGDVPEPRMPEEPAPDRVDVVVPDPAIAVAVAVTPIPALGGWFAPASVAPDDSAACQTTDAVDEDAGTVLAVATIPVVAGDAVLQPAGTAAPTRHPAGASPGDDDAQAFAERTASGGSIEGMSVAPVGDALPETVAAPGREATPQMPAEASAAAGPHPVDTFPVSARTGSRAVRGPGETPSSRELDQIHAATGSLESAGAGELVATDVSKTPRETTVSAPPAPAVDAPGRTISLLARQLAQLRRADDAPATGDGVVALDDTAAPAPLVEFSVPAGLPGRAAEVFLRLARESASGAPGAAEASNLGVSVAAVVPAGPAQSATVPSDGAGVVAPAEPLSPAMGEAVAHQVVSFLKMRWREGVGEATLHLRPDGLGSVMVALRVEAGSVTAAMRADSPQVQDWILQHQQTLREQMASAGLRLDDLVVTPDGQRDRRGQDEAPADERRRRQPATEQTSAVTFEQFLA